MPSDLERFSEILIPMPNEEDLRRQREREAGAPRREGGSATHFVRRCQANMAHIIQSRPDSDLVFQAKVLTTF